MIDVAKVIKPAGPHRDRALTRQARLLGFPEVSITASEIFFLRGDTDAASLRQLVPLLIDDAPGPKAQLDGGEQTSAEPDHLTIEVARRAGVTDRVAVQLSESAARHGLRIEAATGTRFEITGAPALPEKELRVLVHNLLCNPVIETWSFGAVTPGFAHGAVEDSSTVEIVPLRGLGEAELAGVNASRALALDPEEMAAVAAWFAAAGRDPTDAELETIAQTWSDHCSHKTFGARIETAEGEITPLLRQLRETTKEIAAPFVISAFDGNAGIVAFADGLRLAVKAETHNHPSAIEPFGGANTGVGGVIRDILAAPARPVALTDILCFGPRDLDRRELPEGVLHPAVIEEGVVEGVADYGNKMGIPTVAGAVLYDAGYTANPLVFCGCVGEVMAGYDKLTGPQPGDRIVVVGGATGRDGIRGATFSSMTMDATTGEVAGASVQIGDPIIERLVTDLLIDLLDRPDPLVHALTDCGAGGLSSAVGELGESTGVAVDLTAVDRKYPGLLPWEVWLSEAQERMVLAVAPDQTEAVLARARHLGLSACDIGKFTGDRRLFVRHGEKTVVDLPMEFLHRGRPQRNLVAILPSPDRRPDPQIRAADATKTLLALLAHPNIASKEAIIRRYDHEVLGATVVRPMAGARQVGPSDGTVIAPPQRPSGFALGIGVNARYGLLDPERMAWAVVDEALRNVTAAGADPAQVALLDNFSWGDPRRPETLGDLAATVRGCCQAARLYGAPFVSGKDSLNNEYVASDGQRRSIPPTLVITALAHMPQADRAIGTALRGSGNVLILTGCTAREFGGSHFDLVTSHEGGTVPAPDPSAPERYRRIHQLMNEGLVAAAHDVSEGGLAVTLAEMVIGGHLGIDARLDDADECTALFAESLGRIVLEARAEDTPQILEALGREAAIIGRVVSDYELRIATPGGTNTWSGHDLERAWRGAAS
ncbi:MAG: phosphoribosylformylglycinamidine synthase subunit PurL [Chthoniobacterales bacterium]